MRRFLWGGQEGNEKISWIKWESLCRPRAEGGLGIIDWTLFNTALLAKWRWRLRHEGSSLWCRILRCKYGSNLRGDVNIATASSSSWWKDVCSVCTNGTYDSWFDNCCVRRLGSGNEIGFWHENWLGAVTLRHQFSRLYRLSTQQMSCIRDCGSWDNDRWVWNLHWSRPLLDRELNMVRNLLDLICGVNFTPNSPDKWVWTASGDGKFSVRSSYLLLLGSQPKLEDLVFSKIWKVSAPTNPVSFAWRTFHDRIPSRSNLRKRLVITSADDAVCPFCKVVEETSAHLLFQCWFSASIWNICLDWLGIQWVSHDVGKNHFRHFISLCPNSRSQLILGAIWCTVTWSLWTARNNSCFKGLDVDMSNLMDLIKFRSWNWIWAKTICFIYSLQDWNNSPMNCLV